MLYQFRRELIQELKKQNQIVLSMPFVGHEKDFKAMGCKCIKTNIDRRGINPATDFKLLKTYFHILEIEKPDLVITYSIKPNIYAGFICSIKRIPYCANVQGLGTAFQKKGLAAFVTILYKTAFRKVKAVFFENEGNAAEFRKRHIIPNAKQIALNGAGVNMEYYHYLPYPDDDPIHFLFVGRIMKEKGVDELFSAMRRLKKEYGDRVILDIVGFFEDEYKEVVKWLVRDGVVVFHGFQQDVRPYYAMAHCIVLPSYHEGMSNVLLEAAATGRPIITSDIPGCREAVEDGKNGYLCRVRNTGDVYQSMRKILKNGKEQNKTMGEYGRRKMKSEFEKCLIVDKTIQVLMKYR